MGQHVGQNLSKLSGFFQEITGKIRGKWDEASMKSAIEKVMLKQMTIRTASIKFGVSRSTLGDRVKILLKGGETTPKFCCSNNKGVFQKTFTDEQEEILYEHVKALDGQLMPLSRTEFLKLAYNLAKRLNVCDRFNKEKRMAGKDFYYEFMNRHKDLSLRTAEPTSLQRAVGFSKDKVDRFFDQLTKLMDKHKFNPTRVFNADETGVSCVHNNNLKVMSVKGKKQERGVETSPYF
ncbi:CENP-B N-terminal DNA-binding domain [Popillia japonica]|uniref:CENP-B N-terminal DNA-binding domain n=1 Tax=Popillia japonica TaxID=7064 RepID=A0AAW1KPT1_POPJA